MDTYFKALAAALVALILIFTLQQYNKQTALLLGIGICCMVSMAAVSFLKPVLDFLQTLEEIGGLDQSMVQTLWKAAGIGLLTEVGGLICKDAGNASLGKSVTMLGTGAVLWLSLPLFTGLLELLQRIMGEL